MIPLSAKDLFRQPVVTDLGLRNNISLFPLFEGEGVVRQLIVVSEAPARIYLLNWRPGLVTKPYFRPLQLNASLQALEEATAEDARLATAWWHYDPWWLLTERGLVDHSATPFLRQTNCVAELTGVNSMFFRRDLSRVTLVNRATGPSQWECKALEPGTLPKRSAILPRSTAEPGKGGWVLRPFWQRRPLEGAAGRKFRVF